jgi:protoporphyrinogen oxidase
MMTKGEVMQENTRNRKKADQIAGLLIAPFIIAGLLLYLPSLPEPTKIFLLGIALTAAGFLGRRWINRRGNPQTSSIPQKSTTEENYVVPRRPVKDRVVIIGGGPAGLTAAYKLTGYSVPTVVLEKSHIVGGLSRTENYKGYRFDMGGHRFFTKSKSVQEMWEEVLGSDFMRRPRLSRIYYRRQFFAYPLKPIGTLRRLGLVNGLQIILSYLRSQLFPYRNEQTFEHWVSNRFGKRLFEIFFKSYTEKVWGISCSELRAEWAAQRIKSLTLWSAVWSMFWKPRTTITTLIDQFHYPRLGPGMMWNAVKKRIDNAGGQVLTQCEVVRIKRTNFHVDSVVIRRGDQTEILEGSDFISSMPLTELIARLEPPPPADVLRAASILKYRDFITVCLIVNKRHLFSDNWIYVHDPEVKVGRIQNFKSWSPAMVPDPSTSSLGLEYFCTEGDDLWNTPDAELIALGKREAEQMGLMRSEDVLDGCVFRIPKAYPIYDSSFRGHVATVREFMDRLENIQTIGRNGLHRYDNQDHAMLTGMWAVRNILFGERHDLWQVNTEQEYHEEIRGDGYEDEIGLDDLIPPFAVEPLNVENAAASASMPSA